MTTKTIIVAVALVLSATSASLAQGFYLPDGGYAPGYGSGYGNAPEYSFSGPQYGYDVYASAPGYRGGPGPRVGSGQGMGAGSQR
jgi:hypothetical protein